MVDTFPADDENLADRIRAAANHLVENGATSVYVFGSAAGHRLRPESDVDLAVAGLPPSSFFRLMAEVSLIVGRHCDLLDLDRAGSIAKSVLRSPELRRVA